MPPPINILTVGSINPLPIFVYWGTRGYAYESLPNSEAIIGTRSSVDAGPPLLLSHCCYVEGARKTYQKPFPLGYSLMTIEPIYSTPS